MRKGKNKKETRSVRGILVTGVMASLLAVGACIHDDDDSNNSGQMLNMSPRASLIADVNNDGLQDLIVDTDLSGRNRNLLLLNQGDYTFDIRNKAFPPKYAGSDGITVAFNSGHFNDDNHLDIIAITVDDYVTSKVQVYFGDGMGGFEDAGDVVSGPAVDADGTMEAWPEWVRVADFDGDGFDDFVLTTPGSCDEFCNRIYLNDGSGSFSVAQISFDDGVNTYTNDTLEWDVSGDPEPDSADQRRDDIPGDLFVGDLNGDGKMDLFAPGSLSRVAMASFINRSQEPGNVQFEVRFSKAQGEIYTDDQPSMKNAVLADVNNDGFPDLIGSKSIASMDDVDTVPVLGFLNRGDGTMNLDNNIVREDVGVVHARQWLAIDSEMDGGEEVFIADHGTDSGSFPGVENVFLSYQQDGTLADVVTERLSDEDSYTHGASVGDLNDDGYPDLFLNNSGPSDSSEAVPEKRFWINDGNGEFSPENPKTR